MAAENLNDAQLECLNDQSCDMFYRVCDYPESRFRKCTNTAETEYEEPSTCGDIIGPSSLYKKGNTYGIWYFPLSIIQLIKIKPIYVIIYIEGKSFGCRDDDDCPIGYICELGWCHILWKTEPQSPPKRGLPLLSVL